MTVTEKPPAKTSASSPPDGMPAPGGPPVATEPPIHIASTGELVYRTLLGGLASIALIAGFGNLFFQSEAREFIGPIDPRQPSGEFFLALLLNNLSVAGIVVSCAVGIQLLVHHGYTGDLYYGARTFTDVLLSVIVVRNLLLIGIALAAWPGEILQGIALHAIAEISAFTVLAVLYMKARRKVPLSLEAMCLWIAGSVVCIIIGAGLEGLV